MKQILGNNFGLARQTLLIIILKVCSLLLGLSVTVILARNLGPSDFGKYSFVVAAASLMVIPAHAGIATLLVRETAANYALGNWGLVRGFWRWSFQLSAVMILAVLTLFMIVLWIYDSELAKNFWILISAVFLLPLLAANSLRAAVMRGIGEPVKGILLEALIKPGLLLLGILGLAYTSFLTPGSALVSLVLATSVSTIAGYLWFRQLRRPETVDVTPEFLSSKWRSSVVPLALLVGAQMFVKYTDIVMLGVFRTPADVGQYRIATQASDLILFVLVGVTIAVGPQIAQLYALESRKHLQKLVLTASRVSFCAAALSFVVLLSFGEQLLKFVFGIDYAVAIVPLLILSLGQLFLAFFGLASTILTMTGGEKTSLKIFLTASIANIILNAILIPLYGMVGAALSTAATLSVAHAILSNTVNKKMELRTTPV